MSRKNGKTGILVKIMAGILAALMVLSVGFTLIYCLIEM